MLSRAIKDDVAEVAQGVGELLSSQKGNEAYTFFIIYQFAQTLNSLDQESQDIITWLSPLNFYTKQNDFLQRRQDGTGEWLLEDNAFKEWLYGPKRTLWCPGLRMTAPFVRFDTIILF